MRCMAGVPLLAMTMVGCFSPDRDSGVTVAGSSDGSTFDGSTSMQETGVAESASSESVTTADEATESTSTSGTGDETEGAPPDFGVGDPPEFGDLGPIGEGQLLVVNALADDIAVDVWLAGEATLRHAALGPKSALRLAAIERGPHRVVLTEAGTPSVVSCSDWFPVRRDEQHAVVATLDPHTCRAEGPSTTLTFAQSTPLDRNPLRFVHGAVPDALTVLRDGTPEPGSLEPGGTLTAGDLPGCATGCNVAYAIQTAFGVQRDFTFGVDDFGEIPTSGEILLVVLGDPREDWPEQSRALELLRVDLDGATTRLRRDPDLAFVSVVDATVPIELSVLAEPTIFPLAVVEPCFEDCPSYAQRFSPGNFTFFASSTEINASAEVELVGGHRYVLLARVTDPATDPGSLDVLPIQFDRDDAAIAQAQVWNVAQGIDTLTVGVDLSGNAVAIPGLETIVAGQLSGSATVPSGGWSLIHAVDGDALLRGCFESITTDAGFRGFLAFMTNAEGGERFASVDTTEWPPTSSFLPRVCF